MLINFKVDGSNATAPYASLVRVTLLSSGVLALTRGELVSLGFDTPGSFTELFFSPQRLARLCLLKEVKPTPDRLRDDKLL